MRTLGSGEFLSATAAERESRSFRITETVYAQGQRLPDHTHEKVYLVVLTSGVLRETARGREHDLVRGHVVFDGAGATHRDVAGAGTRCLNVELRSDVSAWFDDGRAARAEPVIYTRVGPALGAVGRLQTALLGPHDELAVEESITDLLGAVFGDSRRRPERFPWLGRVLDHLHAAFRDGLRLDDVAATAGVHRTHLCRSFRTATGCTLGEYVRRLRADRAFRRLGESDVKGGTITLGAIAAECGYADQSHMTREIRRRYGRSPSALRRALR